MSSLHVLVSSGSCPNPRPGLQRKSPPPPTPAHSTGQGWGSGQGGWRASWPCGSRADSPASLVAPGRPQAWCLGAPGTGEGWGWHPIGPVWNSSEVPKGANEVLSSINGVCVCLSGAGRIFLPNRLLADQNACWIQGPWQRTGPQSLLLWAKGFSPSTPQTWSPPLFPASGSPPCSGILCGFYLMNVYPAAGWSQERPGRAERSQEGPGESRLSILSPEGSEFQLPSRMYPPPQHTPFHLPSSLGK